MLWVADITYIPTSAGFLYLAVVLDAFRRRIVGWSMAITLHSRVVLDALSMALWQRQGRMKTNTDRRRERCCAFSFVGGPHDTCEVGITSLLAV